MIDETPCTCCNLRPAQPDRYLCRDCCDQWHADLQAAPDWLTELDTETARRTRKTSGTGHAPTGREQPLPINLRAADHASMLSLHLTACIAILGHGEAPALPDTDTRVDWLLRHEDQAALHPAGGPLAWRLRELTRQAARICDRPPERHVYLGICPACDAPMRTTRDEGNYRCDCGLTYDIATRKSEVDARVWDPDNNMTQSEAATLLGVPLNTIKQRVKNRRIEPIIGNGRGAWYRLGDIA